MISLGHFVLLAGATFVIGMAGCLRRRGHVALVVMSSMMMMLAALVLIVAAQAYAGDVPSLFWAFSLTFAAIVHAGVAAGLMICVYRRRGALALRRINASRG